MSWPKRDRVMPVNPDVADLIGPELMPEEIQHLERVFRLEPDDPIWGLLLWQPTDPDDVAVRAFLLGIVKAAIKFHEDARRSLQARGKA